ncbi:E3 ubiquitin-protein ligase Midline-1-like isoform X2 [Petromyzon marinus]|nr:E3 ubiquitin-protein ligase Midline-1-like isoform X2 [Petromyzon marinus]
MASCAPSLQEELTCSVCLSLYDDPVQLQCRHNLCRACFRRMCELNTYVRCPECQTDVTGRRVEANMKLRNVVDSYLKSITSGGGGRFKLAGGCRSLDACSSSTSSSSSPPSPSSPSSPSSSPAVPCSFCRRDAQRPAVRTCAKCEVSFCEEHVRPHYENSCFRGHVLLQPTARLAERRCTDHDEPLKLYCAVDDALVCSVCVLAGGHRDHPVRTLAQHAHHVRDLLEDKTRNLEGKIGLFEKFLQQAEQKNQEIELKTDRLKKEASDMLDTIRHHLIQEEEKVRRNIEKDATRARQVVAAAVAHVSSSDLKALHEVKTTIEKITEEKDDFYLLKAYSSHVKSLNAVSAIAVPKIQRDFEVQDEVVPADWLQRVVKGIPIKEPEKASLAFEGAVQHAMLRISNEGRTVTVSAHPQLGFAGLYHPPHRRHGRSARPRGERQLAHAPLPLHGNPFKDMWNIMCSQGFAYGRHYWEVMLSPSMTGWAAGVAYRQVERSGPESRLGRSTSSWALEWVANFTPRCTFWHGNVTTVVQCPGVPRRLMVVLDVDRGSIAYYDADSKLEIFCFVSKFSEPLYPCFCLGSPNDFLTLV